MLAETDKAYMAGIIDGEGSIALIRRHAAKYSHNPFYATTYQPQITVVQSEDKLLKWILNKFGGKIDRIDNKHNHIWRWTISTKNTPLFLKLILPYLHLKRKQAILILEYIEKYTGKHLGKKPMPIRLRKEREAHYQKLKSLHIRKGRPPVLKQTELFEGENYAC